MIYSETLKTKSNEALLEEYGLVCASHYEDPDDIGFDSAKYDLEQELLSRMK